MGFLSSLKGLFGGDGSAAGASSDETVDYQDFKITPAPERQSGGWNTAGVIRKTIDGETKEQRFIRVDTHSSREEAVRFSIVKARQIIDEQGDRLFQQQ